MDCWRSLCAAAEIARIQQRGWFVAEEPRHEGRPTVRFRECLNGTECHFNVPFLLEAALILATQGYLEGYSSLDVVWEGDDVTPRCNVPCPAEHEVQSPLALLRRGCELLLSHEDTLSRLLNRQLAWVKEMLLSQAATGGNIGEEDCVDFESCFTCEYAGKCIIWRIARTSASDVETSDVAKPRPSINSSIPAATKGEAHSRFSSTSDLPQIGTQYHRKRDIEAGEGSDVSEKDDAVSDGSDWEPARDKSNLGAPESFKYNFWLYETVASRMRDAFSGQEGGVKNQQHKQLLVGSQGHFLHWSNSAGAVFLLQIDTGNSRLAVSSSTVQQVQLYLGDPPLAVPSRPAVMQLPAVVDDDCIDESLASVVDLLPPHRAPTLEFYETTADTGSAHPSREPPPPQEAKVQLGPEAFRARRGRPLEDRLIAWDESHCCLRPATLVPDLNSAAAGDGAIDVAALAALGATFHCDAAAEITVSYFLDTRQGSSPRADIATVPIYKLPQSEKSILLEVFLRRCGTRRSGTTGLASSPPCRVLAALSFVTPGNRISGLLAGDLIRNDWVVAVDDTRDTITLDACYLQAVDGNAMQNALPLPPLLCSVVPCENVGIENTDFVLGYHFLQACGASIDFRRKQFTAIFPRVSSR